MSAARIGVVLRQELAYHLRRPLFVCWLLLATLLLWGLSGGVLRIQSGDSTVGGTKAFLTSGFAQAQTFAILTPLLYTFFVAALTGLSLQRDQDARIGELLHSTPLRPGEYVLGKLGAGLLAVVGMLTLHVLLAVGFNHVGVDAASADYIGPLVWSGYVRAAVWFGLPGVVLVAGVAFWVGARTRSAVAVFVLPLVGLGVCLLFLWEWSPSWLDPRIDRALALVDPTGLRWLRSTWLDVDRGVEFYNHTPVPLDAGFVASRVALVLLGLGAGLWTARTFRVRERERPRARAAGGGAAAPARGHAPHAAAPLTALGMRTARPSMVAGFLRVLRVELRELRAQPGLYLFVPLILLDTFGEMSLAEGPFGTQVLQTSGTLAVGALPGLTLLVSLLLMFYTVESLARERRVGLAPLVDASATRTGVVVAAKVAANAVVGAVVLAAALLACWVVLLRQGTPQLDPRPFALVWGGLLLPTYVVWCAFVALLYSLTRSAYATYGLGLGAVVGTGWLLALGHMNWARNWILWTNLAWSDFGTFPLDREALVWNRTLALAAAVLFGVLALELFPRREPDAQRTLQRLRPRAFLRSAALLTPLWLPVVGLYVWISSQVAHGWEGERAEEARERYWRRNVETWADAPQPDVAAVDVRLVLEPERRHLASSGTLTLVNRLDEPLRRFALTGNPLWEDVHWTLEDAPFEAESRQHLWVFEPEAPLAPGATVRVGFELAGVLHPHFSRNGDGASQFVLPEGVVLHSFAPTFVPLVGFVDGLGLDEDLRPDAQDWEPDFFVGDTPSAFGAGAPFPVRLEVQVPERFDALGVGVRTRDEVADGRRTVVWESDHPVSFFNVVAGEYAVARGDGVVVHHHPAHAANVPTIVATLEAARARYGEWFHPFPWTELKLTEFPALATYAQGFATNITFSEGIGFLARPTAEVDAPFFVTAHEAAHQWWGNLLVPGEGPGGNVLSEGLAHYATILLTEAERGPAARIAFCRRIEERYGEARVADSERPLVWVDGSRPGDETVTYDRGGWVMWMLQQELGREACLDGLRSFIQRYLDARDHPVLFDLVEHLRGYAADADAYDAFVAQWLEDTVVPRFELRDVRLLEGAGGPEAVELVLVNAGTGTVSVEVAAQRGQPPSAEPDAGVESRPDDGHVVAAERSASASVEPPAEARVRVEAAAGAEVSVRIPLAFRPDRVVVDPDALVLQLERDRAVHAF